MKKSSSLMALLAVLVTACGPSINPDNPNNKISIDGFSTYNLGGV